MHHPKWDQTKAPAQMLKKPQASKTAVATVTGGGAAARSTLL